MTGRIEDNDKLRVACVVGTRPEAIKLAPVIGELARRSSQFHQSVVATAQHRELLDQMFQNLDLHSDFDLDLMRDDQLLAEYASRSLESLSNLFSEIKPDIVVGQGDTTTVMTAALAAKYNGADVAHVEAGLRSFDLTQPFPEEINRRIATVLTSIHFAPTETARANLLAEGVQPSAILVTGNTIVDAVRSVDTTTDFDNPDLANVPFETDRVVLVTAHRRENHGRPLTNICRALVEIVRSFPDVSVIFPVHPNPHVREVVGAELAHVERVHLYPPLPYLDLLRILRRCWLVITDSGGLQEESSTFGKPVLILRDVTERPEVVTAGAGRLVGTNQQTIVLSVAELHNDQSRYAAMASHPDLFGDGRAAKRIGDALASRAVERTARARG